MPFCGKCGSSVNEGVAFCGKCGAPVAPSSGAVQTSVAGKPLESNIAALLSYLLWIVGGIIFLVLEPYKNDKFVRFHAFQSIFLSIASIIFMVVWNGILWSLFSGGLWIVLGPLGVIVRLAIMLLWLFLMYKAYNNETFKIPFIGDLAAKQAGL
jgi:uncharacterized membrane protein